MSKTLLAPVAIVIALALAACGGSARRRAGSTCGRSGSTGCDNHPISNEKAAPEGGLFLFIYGMIGAVEKTRTSTSCDTATSTLRVYQFRHDRTLW